MGDSKIEPRSKAEEIARTKLGWRCPLMRHEKALWGAAVEWAAQQCEAGDCTEFDGRKKCHKEDAKRIRAGKS